VILSSKIKKGREAAIEGLDNKEADEGDFKFLKDKNFRIAKVT